MNCGTCARYRSPDRIQPGMRVTVSNWEKSMLGRDLVGTVLQLGHPDTARRGTAKVEWDSGYKDQWWPMNALIPGAR